MKWDRYAGRDVIPLWVGDMDFQAPPAVRQAIEQRLQHGVLGYTRLPDSLVHSLIQWHSRRHGWQIEPEWILPLPGLVPSLSVACLACAPAQASVAVPDSVYGPFFKAVRKTGRRIAPVPVRHKEGRPLMSAEDLRRTVQVDTSLLMLCNPHNPGGTVYSQRELEQLAEVCLEHRLWICSDEIHCDMVYRGRHIHMAALSEEIAARTITLVSPSKCFNLAGMSCGFAIIPDPDLRLLFKQATMGALGDVSALSYVAAEAAYRHCEPWLEQLLAYLRANRDLVCSSLATRGGLKVHSPQSSFFAWVDLRSLGIENVHAHFEQYGIGLSDGDQFGSPGWARINFGTRRELLEEGLQRFHLGLEAAR